MIAYVIRKHSFKLQLVFFSSLSLFFFLIQGGWQNRYNLKWDKAFFFWWGQMSLTPKKGMPEIISEHRQLGKVQNQHGKGKESW